MSDPSIRVLTIEAAAAELAVTTKTLRQWRDTRAFPLHIVGKRSAYVIWSEVLNWLRGDSPPERPMAGATPDAGRDAQEFLGRHRKRSRDRKASVSDMRRYTIREI